MYNNKAIALTNCWHKKYFTGEGAILQAIEILNEFMQDKRVVGHQFNADQEWFLPLGMDLRPQYAAPTSCTVVCVVLKHGPYGSCL